MQYKAIFPFETPQSVSSMGDRRREIALFRRGAPAAKQRAEAELFRPP
jgi:hypothetical protein